MTDTDRIIEAVADEHELQYDRRPLTAALVAVVSAARNLVQLLQQDSWRAREFTVAWVAVRDAIKTLDALLSERGL